MRVIVALDADGMRQEARVGPQHVVIVLAALTAELDRDEDPAAAGLDLAFQRELAPVRRFERGKQRPALADELVQLEGEGPSAVVANQIAAAVEQLAQPLFADGRVSTAARLRQAFRGRRPSVRGTRRFSRPPSSGSTPNSVSAQRASGCRRKCSSVAGIGPASAVASSAPSGSPALGKRDERLLDDLIAGERMTEQPLGELGDRGRAAVAGWHRDWPPSSRSCRHERARAPHSVP